MRIFEFHAEEIDGLRDISGKINDTWNNFTDFRPKENGLTTVKLQFIYLTRGQIQMATSK